MVDGQKSGSASFFRKMARFGIGTFLRQAPSLCCGRIWPLPLHPARKHRHVPHKKRVPPLNELMMLVSWLLATCRGGREGGGGKREKRGNVTSGPDVISPYRRWNIMTGPLVALGGAAVAVTSVVVVKEVSRETCCPPPPTSFESFPHHSDATSTTSKGKVSGWCCPNPVLFCLAAPLLRSRGMAIPLSCGATSAHLPLGPPPPPHTLYLLPRNLTISFPHLLSLVMKHPSLSPIVSAAQPLTFSMSPQALGINSLLGGSSKK
jgi:hypothetical protein